MQKVQAIPGGYGVSMHTLKGISCNTLVTAG